MLITRLSISPFFFIPRSFNDPFCLLKTHHTGNITNKNVIKKLYAVLGAHIDLNFKAFNVSFWGRNLTDTNYNTFAVDNSATGTKEYFAQRGNPFQCGVDVRFHF